MFESAFPIISTPDLARALRFYRPLFDGRVDQPWGERVARVHDPDGNVAIVGSNPG